MSGSIKSPLGRLVLFMICLSVAGTFVAGAHYVAVDLPGQQVTQAPSNDICDDRLFSCLWICDQLYNNGYSTWAEYQNCAIKGCQKEYSKCSKNHD
jgi:hypothetical protein